LRIGSRVNRDFPDGFHTGDTNGWPTRLYPVISNLSRERH
jgi:hypothetical protein